MQLSLIISLYVRICFLKGVFKRLIAAVAGSVAVDIGDTATQVASQVTLKKYEKL